MSFFEFLPCSGYVKYARLVKNDREKNKKGHKTPKFEKGQYTLERFLIVFFENMYFFSGNLKNFHATRRLMVFKFSVDPFKLLTT
jgi:hypothetical protein